MKKGVKEAAEEQYQNKVVWNQRGGSIEIDNSTGTEGIYLTHYSGSNTKMTPSVTSEYAVNNKQTEVVNDYFETIRNNRNTYIGGDHVERIIGSKIRQNGYSSPEQVEAVKQWKAAYKPVAERNSMFPVQRGGVSYPNGVTMQEAGARDKNPTRNQELYRNQTNPEGPPMTMPLEIPVVGDGVNQVATMEGFESPIPQFEVSNPNEEDFGEAESPSTENGIYPPEPKRATLPADIKLLQETQLTPLEQKMGGEGAQVGGDTQEFTFRNVEINVGAAFNDYPSIRTDPKGRAVPASLKVGTNSGAFTDVEAVPHVEEVDNSRFPVGTRETIVGNRDVLSVGSGGVQIKTTGSMEIGATMYKLGANQIHLNSDSGVYIDSPNLVSISSRNKISLASNKQVFINPSLGVKNDIKVGGSAYIQGETYLHHVTAPQEIQTTELAKVFAKPVTGKIIGKVTVAGGGSYAGGIFNVYAGSVDGDADEDSIECYDHQHNFYNLPLRLTNSSGDVAKVSEGENINVDGFSTPAQAVTNGGQGATEQSSLPSSPRELVKQAANTLLPHDRSLVTALGDIKPPLPQLEKFGSFAKETVQPAAKAVQSLVPGVGQSTADLAIDAAGQVPDDILLQGGVEA